MSFKGSSSEYLNCRLQFSKRSELKPLPHLRLAYTTSLSDSKDLCQTLGIEGNFSEKSYKVVGVTEGFDAGMTADEMKNHGRWKSALTPNIYYVQNKKKKMELSRKIT